MPHFSRSLREVGPAVMDNYWLSSGPPEVCKNDAITRQFLLDRLKAKIARP